MTLNWKDTDYAQSLTLKEKRYLGVSQGSKDHILLGSLPSSSTRKLDYFHVQAFFIGPKYKFIHSIFFQLLTFNFENGYCSQNEQMILLDELGMRPKMA